MKLVGICKKLNIDIIASEIVSRGDALNVKGKAVNKCLKEMCKSNKQSRPYPLKFFKGCLPQILLGPFLNTLSQMFLNTFDPKIKLR